MNLPRQKMSLETVQAIADAELEKWGLDEKGWTHVFENFTGAKAALGHCSSGCKEIRSNRYYIEYGLSPEQIVDTIRHEIAHALDGPPRYSRPNRRTGRRSRLVHDKVWRKWAIIVGAKPSRSAADLDGFIAPNTKMQKWTLVTVSKDLKSYRFELEYSKFLTRLSGRFFKGKRAEQEGYLWLVDTVQYRAFEAGEVDGMILWQDNPAQDPFWGTPKSMEITR